MANTFYLQSKKKYDGRYLYVDFQQLPSIADNESRILWTLYSAGGKDKYYAVGPTTLTVDGKRAYYCERKPWDSYEFPAKEGSVSGELIIPHDMYGEKTVVITLSTAIYNGSWDVPNNTITASWALDKITRSAIISSAEDFTDEGFPSLSFIPAGLGVLSAWIEVEGDVLCRRDDINNNGSYTWDLSPEERNELLSKCVKNSCVVKYVLQTNIDGVDYIDEFEKTMKVINADPEITEASVVETNQTVIDLIGPSDFLIANKSTVSATASFVLKKGAELSSYTVTQGNVSKVDNPAEFTNITDGVFVYVLTDSRDNQYTVTIEKQVIPYGDVSCVIDKVSSSPDPSDDNDSKGAIKIMCSGDYYDSKIGDISNYLDVICEYRLKGSQTWISGGSMVITDISEGKYKAEKSIVIDDYHATYEVRVHASDVLGGVYSNVRTVKTIPLAHYGASDWAFTVPVFAPSFNVNQAGKVINDTLEIEIQSKICIVYAVGLDGYGSGAYLIMQNEPYELVQGNHVDDIYMNDNILSLTADSVGFEIFIQSIV